MVSADLSDVNLDKNSGRMAAVVKDGGPDQDRTDDLRIANAALSQLSYRPTNLQCSGAGPAVNAWPGGDGTYVKVSMMAASTSGPGFTVA